MTDYDEAMADLDTATWAAVRAALVAVKSAGNTDGEPVEALSVIRGKLADIAADVDCLIDHNCTRADFESARALYEGAKLAGLTGRNHD